MLLHECELCVHIKNVKGRSTQIFKFLFENLLFLCQKTRMKGGKGYAIYIWK